MELYQEKNFFHQHWMDAGKVFMYNLFISRRRQQQHDCYRGLLLVYDQSTFHSTLTSQEHQQQQQ